MSFLIKPRTNLYLQTIIYKNMTDLSFWATQAKVRTCMHSSSVVCTWSRATVLDEPGKIALHNYLNKGGNFAAVHSASDCLRTTSFYGREVGELSSHLSPASQSDLEKEPTLITIRNCKMLYVLLHRPIFRLNCLNPLDCRRHRP